MTPLRVPGALLGLDDVERVLERERLEVEAVGGVVVGRHGLRVAVEHHRLVARVGEGEAGVHAAVVELDALPDAVRPGAEDQHLLPAGVRDLVLVLVGGVVVRRRGLELGRAGVDGLERGAHAGRQPGRPHVGLGHRPQPRRAGRRRTRGAWPGARRGGPSPSKPISASAARSSTMARIWSRNHGSTLVRSASTSTVMPRRSAASSWNGRSGVPMAARLRSSSSSRSSSAASPGSQRQAEPAVLEAAHRLLERLGEGPADRHRLPHRLHRRAEDARRAGELLEGPARHLGDDVVDGRLEAGGRGPGDVVGDLVERVADRELGGDLGDREPGGLRRERRRTRHPRVHLDDDHVAVGGVEGELHVRPARLDADPADAREGGVAHQLVLDVAEGLGGRHRDRVARVDAHRVEVLDRADDHAVVRAIAHHLELVLLPPGDRPLDEDLVHRAGGEAVGGQARRTRRAWWRCRCPCRPGCRRAG